MPTSRRAPSLIDLIFVRRGRRSPSCSEHHSKSRRRGGRKDAQRFLTGTYQFGHAGTSTQRSGARPDGRRACDGMSSQGRGHRSRACASRSRQTRATSRPPSRPRRRRTIGSVRTSRWARVDRHSTISSIHASVSSAARQRSHGRAPIKAKDKAVDASFDAAQRELIEDMIVVCHERRKIDAQIRRGMDESGGSPCRRTPAQGLDRVGVKIPDEAQPWNFDPGARTPPAPRASQDLRPAADIDGAKPEAFQLKKYGEIGWD